MVHKFVAAFVLVIAVAFLPVTAGAAQAAGQKNKGLYISPLHQELSVAPDKKSSGTFTVANYTKKPLTVNLSIKQFDTTNYTYDYKFKDAHDDWVKLQVPQVVLQPDQSTKVYFSIDVPHLAAPGGHYFAFFASAEMSEPTDGVRQTAQVVSLLYVKVIGKLIQTGSIENGSVPFLFIGSKIPFQFDAKNTGNVHYTAYIYGQLDGIFGKQSEYGTQHVLMPGTVRTVGGSVPSPLFPGLYKLTYGYKTDFDPEPRIKTAYVLYVPPWSMITLVLLIFGGVKLAHFIYSKRGAAV